MEKLYNGKGTTLFTASEQGAVAATNLTAESMDWDGYVRPLTAYLYPLSFMEIYDYLKGEYVIDEALLVTGDINNKDNGNEYGWWTRTNESWTGVVRAGGRDATGLFQDDIRDSEAIRGVRPAFHIDSDAVLLASAATGGKPAGLGLQAVSSKPPQQWKLTLLDGERQFAAETKKVKGEKLTFSYTGASTGANEYISVIAKDESGIITHYGKVALAAGGKGTASFTLPESFDSETDKLYAFSEQCNDDKESDYASGMVEIFVIAEKADEAVSQNRDTYRLSFAVNGGSQISSAIISKGTRINLSNYSPTRLGYLFTGWYSDIGLTKRVVSMRLNRDTVVYAGWTPVTQDGAGMSEFVPGKAYDGFADVDESRWYGAENEGVIRDAVMLGITQGDGDGMFRPEDNVKLSEVIKMAAVVHSVYYGNQIIEDSAIWYLPFVEYAIEKGIIKYEDFAGQYDRAATRAEVAYIFAHALPESELGEMGQIIPPDVDKTNLYSEEIYLMYASGVLKGGDEAGTFQPDRQITRGEAAAMIVRLTLGGKR